MHWQGGYGDALDPAEALRQQEQLRAFYAASVHHTAKTKQPYDADFDDFVQEGVIAAWRAVQQPRVEPITYGVVSARRRITSLSSGRYPMTGSESPGKRTYDLARRGVREDFAIADDLEAPGNPYSAVEAHVDVDRALATLAARDQLMARLVGDDQPWEVIGAVLGMTAVGARNRWTRIVRPALRLTLAGLAVP